MHDGEDVKMTSHRQIDARSLAFGRAIAARLIEQPELVEHARANIDRWLKTCSPGVARTLQEWLAVLDGPLSGTIELLTADDERATRLRQSNPFAGLLSNQERNRILRQFHDA
jgi:hypothetical protein